MIVALGVKEASMSASIDERFGRCAFFAICDLDKDVCRFIPNDDQAAQGAGIKAARTLLKNKVDSIIVNDIGPKAFEILDQAGVQVFGGLTGTATDSLNRFRDGKLARLGQSTK